jgi:hypothetical protein
VEQHVYLLVLAAVPIQLSTPQYLMPLVEITLLPSCNNEKKYKPEVKVHTKYLIDTWQVL